MNKHSKRLHRQFDALGRGIPPARGPIAWLLADRMRRVRLPVACLFILGGLVSILPFFGIWMLPLGFLLLAVDLPALRPSVSAIIIRTRRRWAVWRHRREVR
jgi:hypothetical protein